MTKHALGTTAKPQRPIEPHVLYDVIIVGSGISGLIAANACQEQGLRCLILDKGRKPGGRMATRLTGEARFDHGAQYFTARSTAFNERVQEWLEQELIWEWTRYVPEIPQGRKLPDKDRHPRYCVQGGMYRLPAALAADLEVHQSTTVASLAPGPDRWTVAGHRLTDSHPRQPFLCQGRAVLMTCPTPQSVALLQASEVELPAEITAQLRGISYDPCFAVMGVSPTATRIPSPGGFKLREGPIAWIADNSQKGVVDEPVTVTIHATPAFSRQHLDDDKESIGQHLVAAAKVWLPEGLTDLQVHRWLYSQPARLAPPEGQPCIMTTSPLPIAFAGDAFVAPRVEGAVLSGLGAADALQQTLQESPTLAKKNQPTS